MHLKAASLLGQKYGNNYTPLEVLDGRRPQDQFAKI